MKIYKITFAISIVMSVTSFLIGFHFSYIFPVDFFENISIGFMASSLVVLVTSLVSYEVSKEESVQDFYVELISFIDQINNYPYLVGEKDKIIWLYEMKDVDFVSLTHAYMKISFFRRKSGEVALRCYGKSYELLSPVFQNKDKLRAYIDGLDEGEIAKGIMANFEKEIINVSIGESKGNGKLSDEAINTMKKVFLDSEESNGKSTDQLNDEFNQMITGVKIHATYKIHSNSFCRTIKNEMLENYGRYLENPIPKTY